MDDNWTSAFKEAVAGRGCKSQQYENVVIRKEQYKSSKFPRIVFSVNKPTMETLKWRVGDLVMAETKPGMARLRRVPEGTLQAHRLTGGDKKQHGMAVTARISWTPSPDVLAQFFPNGQTRYAPETEVKKDCVEILLPTT